MENDIAAVEVRRHFDRLADFQFAELRFLEIGIDISGRDGDDRHDRGTSADALADLDHLVHDDAIDRRAEEMYPDELSSGWMRFADGVEETLAALAEQSRNAASLPRGIAYPPREQMAGVLLELLR